MACGQRTRLHVKANVTNILHYKHDYYLIITIYFQIHAQRADISRCLRWRATNISALRSHRLQHVFTGQFFVQSQKRRRFVAIQQ